MADVVHDLRQTRILAAAEAHFRRPVRAVSAPGGRGRSSLRLHFDDATVIGTMRADPDRTRHEARILARLDGRCDDLPRYLGMHGDVLFQSDVGARRLAQALSRQGAAAGLDLAAQAVAALLRLQQAARAAGLVWTLPRLGAGRDWVGRLVDGVDLLRGWGGSVPRGFDRAAACEMLACRARRFVKWDCRSGNAALGADGRVRWFDFEFTGTRHGAEDLAWLIGDETLTLAPEDMVDVVIDARARGSGGDIAGYLEYLSVYVTFHVLQRLRLIMEESRRRGWLPLERVLRHDDAGLHPDCVRQLLRVGRYFSAQARVTAPLSRSFDAALQGFVRAQGGALPDARRKDAG